MKPTSDERDAPPQRDYASLYDAKSIEELEEEYRILVEMAEQITTPAYQQHIDAGEYDVIGYGNEVSPRPGDRYKLVSYQMMPVEGSDQKEIRRIELSEGQYLDAYEMLYEAIRLIDEIDRRKAARSADDN